MCLGSGLVCCSCRWSLFLLLMVDSVQKGVFDSVDGRNPANQLIGSSSHYLQGFIHLIVVSRISSINSSPIKQTQCSPEPPILASAWCSWRERNDPPNPSKHNPWVGNQRILWPILRRIQIELLVVQLRGEKMHYGMVQLNFSDRNIQEGHCSTLT